MPFPVSPQKRRPHSNTYAETCEDSAVKRSSGSDHKVSEASTGAKPMSGSKVFTGTLFGVGTYSAQIVV